MYPLATPVFHRYLNKKPLWSQITIPASGSDSRNPHLNDNKSIHQQHADESVLAREERVGVTKHAVLENEQQLTLTLTLTQTLTLTP